MHCRDSFRAERTLRGRVRGDIQAPECVKRDVQLRGTARPIDENRRSDKPSVAQIAQRFVRLIE